MFGNKLRELRKNKNLSQEKLGEILGVTNKVIYDWENNRSQPSIEQIKKIASFFEVSTDYLFGFTQEDITKIKQLNQVAREAGLLKGENDMTMEEFKKAIDIVNLLKKEENK